MIHVVMITSFNPDIDKIAELLWNINIQGCDIVVVDNGSYNALVLKKCLDGLKLKNLFCYYLDRNIGIAAAQNIGLEKYSNDVNNRNFIVTFFDQDSKIQQRFLRRILDDFCEISERESQPVILGPDVYDEKTGKRLTRPKYSYWKIIDQKSSEDFIKVDFVISSGMTMSYQDFLSIGCNDERLFIGYVDIELCMRAVNIGKFRIFISSRTTLEQNIGTKMVDVNGRLVPLHAPVRRYYMTRNSIYLLSKSHMPVGFKIREIYMIFIRLIFDIIVQKQRLSFLKMGGLGFIDGLKMVLKK